MVAEANTRRGFVGRISGGEVYGVHGWSRAASGNGYELYVEDIGSYKGV